ncbi:MAG: type IVB secretion system protein IcmV [Legionellaceae bacterium]|jgi:intracellular multiplication protein IcmV|nr:type IVB secretion system protein IcmV [Legionellaceae bacterium]
MKNTSQGKSKSTAKSRITSLFNRIFKFKYWSDAERVQSFFDYIKNLFQRLFTVQTQEAKESFKKVQSRLHLTDEALEEQKRSLFRLSILMCVFGLCMLGYTIHQVFNGYFFAIVLSLIVSCLAFAFAFRYHFWYFQISQKKLGCSVRTWFNQGLLRRKQP